MKVDVQAIAEVAWRCIKECKDYEHPPVMCPGHQAEAQAIAALAALPSEPPALVALRQAWEAGFTLCRSYGDNAHHFDGEQKERQWQKYVRVALTGDVPPLPTAAHAPVDVAREAISLARHMANTWACVAKAKRDLDYIHSAHLKIDALNERLALTAPATGAPPTPETPFTSVNHPAGPVRTGYRADDGKMLPAAEEARKVLSDCTQRNKSTPDMRQVASAITDIIVERNRQAGINCSFKDVLTGVVTDGFGREHQPTPVGETPAKALSENICTAERPMPKDAPGHWVHPSASCVYSGDDYDRFECPLCGQRFAVTVPQ